MSQLAQINIGRIRYDQDDARMAPFMDALERINALAERSPGFVWRYADASGNATDTHRDGDPRALLNMSVWADRAALEGFVWWVDDGHRPSPAEGLARLEHLRAHGDSDHAFGWSHLGASDLVRAARCTVEAA